MKRALVGLLFAFASAVAWALPSEQDVQNAIKQGQFTQAQSMMAEVVGAKPNNAKAHYIYAEVLAHNGVFNMAAEEAAKARQIDPAIGFTDAAKFRSFEETLQREQSAATTRSSRAVPMSTTSREAAPVSTGGGIPGWIWLVGLVVLGIVLWRGFTRSRAMGGVPPAAAGGYGPGGMNQGYGPGGYGPYGPGGQPGVAPRGGSLLGTGAAVAGGVAGGMLLDQMLHRHDGSSGGGGGGFISDAQANPAAGELENRSIDFGSGNDWDSGGGGGGGIDLGGGGGGDGGSWE